MLFQAILLAASAALASAQITINGSTFTCPSDNLNGDFCAGESLLTNIIVRCNNGVGQPGNCNDNLDGEPPVGDTPTLCWQTSDTSGDAACVKNCVVYCGSGGCTNGTWTLPASLCTPTYTASTSSSTASSTSSSTTGSSSSYTTFTYTTTCTTGSTTTTETLTTTIPCSSSSTYSPPPNNGTTTTATTTGSATNTPTGPTTSSSSAAFTGAAAGYHPAVGGTLAGLGLAVAYFL